jgi:predicted small lipoprotein YifL
MVPSTREPILIRSICLSPAVIGALVAALALTGCGRKGPLELPPGAAASQPAKPASTGFGLGPATTQEAPPTPAAFDAQGRPVAPASGPKKRLPMDWLIE